MASLFACLRYILHRKGRRQDLILSLISFQNNDLVPLHPPNITVPVTNLQPPSPQSSLLALLYDTGSGAYNISPLPAGATSGFVNTKQCRDSTRLQPGFLFLFCFILLFLTWGEVVSSILFGQPSGTQLRDQSRPALAY